jgi:hypothetical protein
MIANIIWNAMKTRCGIVGPYVSCGISPTPPSPPHCNPPSSVPPGPNAIEYPTSAHSSAMIPRARKLIFIVLIVFLSRTSPP